MSIATKPKGPAANAARLAEIELSRVQLFEHDLRDEVCPQEVEQLQQTIRLQGVLQPILVRPIAGNRFECIAGGRRVRAALLARLKTIPAQIRVLSDEQCAEAALCENLSRRDLTPLEIAKALRRLIDLHAADGKPLSHEQLGKRFGYQQVWATNHLAILDLPEVWQRRIASGEITLSAARELFPLCKQPNVLAAVDRDYQEHPEMYSGLRKFQTAVHQVTTAHPAVTAARRTWRDPVEDDTAEASPEESNGRTAAAVGSRQTTPGTMPLTAATGLQPNAIVALLCSRIDALQSLEELDRIQTAIDHRRRELKSRN